MYLHGLYIYIQNADTTQILLKLQICTIHGVYNARKTSMPKRQISVHKYRRQVLREKKKLYLVDLY